MRHPDPNSPATWPASWDGVRWGNTNPVANCAKYYEMPVDLAMVYVDMLIHGTRKIEEPIGVVGYPTDYRSTMTHLDKQLNLWQTSRIRPDEMWNDLKEIAHRVKKPTSGMR